MARARATDEAALIRAAARVFRAKGYHNTTIDDIAEAAQVSRPTVYSYAKSKRWMLERIVTQLLEEIDSRLEADRQVGQKPVERLRSVVNTFVSLAVTHRVLFPVLFNEETELSPTMRKRFRAWAHHTTTDFRELLDECVSDGSFAIGLDPTVAANLIVSMLTSIHRWYNPKGSVSPEQLTDQVLLLIGGVLEDAPSQVRGAGRRTAVLD